MADDLKLTSGLRAILERIERQSPILALLITASGGRARSQVRDLISAGYCNLVDHPRVMDRVSDTPAEALEITDAGREALKRMTVVTNTEEGAMAEPVRRDWCEEHNRGSLAASDNLCPECQQQTIDHLRDEIDKCRTEIQCAAAAIERNELFFGPSTPSQLIGESERAPRPLFSTAIWKSPRERASEGTLDLSGALDIIDELNGEAFHWKTETEVAYARGVEECAQLLDTRAAGYGSIPITIFTGRIMAEELREQACQCRALLTRAQEPK